MCPQYLWIDTPHAYGRTTLKFRFLMGIFKFSDPPYGGSNVIFHQIQNFPQLLYIKLHLKMSGNINFFQFWVILGLLVPPLAKQQNHQNQISEHIGHATDVWIRLEIWKSRNDDFNRNLSVLLCFTAISHFRRVRWDPK